mmetsp:Transcript_10062/g.61117  ORF Transcript_10062/g.61117 Transcript_10062/m.61117 type:complete len:266 (-) Transcript_10062:2388-3185(-)
MARARNVASQRPRALETCAAAACIRRSNCHGRVGWKRRRASTSPGRFGASVGRDAVHERHAGIAAVRFQRQGGGCVASARDLVRPLRHPRRRRRATRVEAVRAMADVPAAVRQRKALGRLRHRVGASIQRTLGRRDPRHAVNVLLFSSFLHVPRARATSSFRVSSSFPREHVVSQALALVSALVRRVRRRRTWPIFLRILADVSHEHERRVGAHAGVEGSWKRHGDASHALGGGEALERDRDVRRSSSRIRLGAERVEEEDGGDA